MNPLSRHLTTADCTGPKQIQLTDYAKQWALNILQPGRRVLWFLPYDK